MLHDQLRALLESDHDLQPRDIAVLAPDIDSYAPFVHAVFGGNNQSLQQIPYALSDGSAIATQPLVEAFLRLLALPGCRFTSNEVLELLAVPAIAQRLQLESADFDLLRLWLLRGRRPLGPGCRASGRARRAGGERLHLGLGAGSTAAGLCQRQRGRPRRRRALAGDRRQRLVDA